MDDDDFVKIFIKREERNKLLNESDKFMLPDYPITSNNLILIKDYRQQLRDYMDLPEVKSYNSSSNMILPDIPKLPF